MSTLERAATCLELAGGGRIDLDLRRWHDEPDEVETALLASLDGPVLDVGCGPGRLVAAVAASGRPALGIDPAPAATEEAARRGAPVLRRSVFAPLPGEGRWASVLLVDGNVGIGGDPVALLHRVGELLRPAGVVLAEVEPPGAPTEVVTVRVVSAGGTGPWFRWARVGADRWAGTAVGAGLVAGTVVDAGGRWFARALAPVPRGGLGREREREA